MDVPDVRYARSGDVAIGYQVIGERRPALDLVYLPIFWNVEYVWESPATVAVLERLSSFCRVIVLDKRGTGVSDRFRDPPTLEIRMDDLRAVLDAVRSERAAFLGAFEGGQLASMFVASYPERADALILYCASARNVAAPDYPWGPSEDEWRRRVRDVAEHWGDRAFLEEYLAEVDPQLARDEEFRRWWVTFSRLCMSPGAAAAFHRTMTDTDIRPVLSAIRVPTLAISRDGFGDHGRFLAERIAGARLSEYPSRGILQSAPAAIFDEIEGFLARLGSPPSSERVLATILFTDIVDSTRHAVRLGDEAWRELLVRHHAVVRGLLAVHRGEEHDTAGDGFFASFDGPGRAIVCACAIRDELRELGLEIRIGLHTGECERVDGKLGGVAVSIGARVAAAAAGGEVRVSSVVRDLVAGSGVAFEDRGEHELKGIPGAWRLYAVVDG